MRTKAEILALKAAAERLAKVSVEARAALNDEEARIGEEEKLESAPIHDADSHQTVVRLSRDEIRAILKSSKESAK